MHKDITEEGAQYTPLWCSFLVLYEFSQVNGSGFKHSPDSLYGNFTFNFLFKDRNQFVVINFIKHLGDVSFNDPCSVLKLLTNLFQSGMAPFVRAKTMTIIAKLRFIQKL